MLSNHTCDCIAQVFGRFYGPRDYEFQNKVNEEFMVFVAELFSPVVCCLSEKDQMNVVESSLNADWPKIVCAFLDKKHGEDAVDIFISMVKTENEAGKNGF